MDYDDDSFFDLLFFYFFHMMLNEKECYFKVEFISYSNPFLKGWNNK